MKTGPKRKPLSERLDDLSIPEPNSGCILWLGTIGGAGYGGISAGGRGGRWIGAHVAAWECTNGDVPAGLHVCHHCDNKLCVNPGHLYLATSRQNTHDAVARGRFKRGEQRRNARFTDEQVREIRRRAAEGTPLVALKHEYGFASHSHVKMLVEGKIWGHVSP